MAWNYYPRFWNEERIEALKDAGKLTQNEVDNIYMKELSK